MKNMKNKKQFTLIELIIVIVVIGILAAMALPKFNGVVRNAKLSAMINDKEVLEKALIMYYQKNDELPLLNEDEELIIANEGISLSKIVLAEEAQNGDMETIYKSLQETLTYYSDIEDSLYRIDLPQIKDNLSKKIKYGHKKHNKDFYVYSTKTGNVYYYDYLVNGNGTIQHSEYDTLLKDNELTTKILSPNLNNKNNNDINLIKDKNIAIGSSYSIKIGADGNLYSWGWNHWGQLGIGNNISQTTPQRITLPNGEKPISISTGYHTIIITDKGNLYSWGDNTYGQLGIGNTETQLAPQLVNLPDGEKPISVSSKGYFSMIITNKGNLYSWGSNRFGELGIGGMTNQTTPQKVIIPNNEKPIHLETGRFHTMIITSEGNVYSWGRNGYGQLGLGNEINQTTPQLLTLPNNEKAVSISLGEYESMILTKNGNIYSCGSNDSGQLGIGDTLNRSTLQKVLLPSEEIPILISSGYSFSMCLTDKGHLYSWGSNSSATLGIGTVGNKTTPQIVNLPNNEKVKSIFAGQSHSIATTDKGNFYTWGYSYMGSLGIDINIHQYTPIKIELP